MSDKSKKARRKATKDKHADNWKYCVKTCILNGKDNHQMYQCNLCEAWVHPECFGEDDKDIIGIWSCASCRMLPTFVESLLEKTSHLESLFRDESDTNSLKYARTRQTYMNRRKYTWTRLIYMNRQQYTRTRQTQMNRRRYTETRLRYICRHRYTFSPLRATFSLGKKRYRLSGARFP